MRSCLFILYFRIAILLFFAASAKAEVCNTLLQPPSRPEVMDYISYMHDLMGPEGKEPLGEFVSHAIPSPANRQEREWQRSNNSFPPPKELRDIIPYPLDLTSWRQEAIHTKKFYQTVYGNYGSSVSNELIDKLTAADDALEISHTTYGRVISRKGVIATWRWFTANPETSRKVLPNDVVSEPKDLPYIRINRIRGVEDLKVSKALKKYMAEGFSVTEIGKLSLRAEDPDIRLRAMHISEMTWLRSAPPDEIFVAHVLSRAHVRLYAKYGLQVAEEFYVPGKDEPEFILWAPGWKLKEALKAYLGVSLVQSGEWGAKRISLSLNP